MERSKLRCWMAQVWASSALSGIALPTKHAVAWRACKILLRSRASIVVHGMPTALQNTSKKFGTSYAACNCDTAAQLCQHSGMALAISPDQREVITEAEKTRRPRR